MKKSYFFKFFVFALVGALVILPSCKDYDDDISRLDKELSSVKTELTGNVTTQLTAVKAEMNTAIDGKVKSVADDLAATKTALTASQAKLTALEASSATKAEVDAVKTQIAAQKAEILEKTVSLEALNNFKAQNTLEIDSILVRIGSLEKDGATKAEVAALRTEITGMVSNLQVALDAIDVRLTALDKSQTELMAKHDTDIQSVIASIAGLKAELDPRIESIETLLAIVEGESGVLNGIAADLADHLTKIGANADAIALLRSDLEAELAEQLVLINANKVAVEAVEDDLAAKYAELVAADAELLAEIEANYDELDDKISLNKDAIEALSLRVKAIEDQLPVIKKSITDLEDDLNLKIDSLFTLAKNRLTSITLAPNTYLDGIEALKFTTLKYRPMEDGENSIIPTVDYNMSIGAPAHASYKFNPRTFVLGNADYGYVNRTAEILTRATSTNIVEIVGEPVYKAADGTVNFTLRRLNAHSTQPTGNKENFIALEATLKGAALAEGESGVVITAPQELVFDQILDASNVRIADKATLEDGNVAHYPTTFDDAKAGKIWYTDMKYNSIYNLKEKVATCLNDGNKHSDFVLEDYGFSYKFAVASSDYNVTTGSTVTNQQEWIDLVDANEGTFKAEDFSKEAIGRTPIMKVELVDQAGNVVRRAFVKVQIGVSKATDMVVGTTHDLLLGCEETLAKYELSENYIRENVYRKIENTLGNISLSHEEFWNMYELDVAKVTKNTLSSSITVPAIVDGDTGTGTATKKIAWSFDHSEIGSVNVGGATLVGSVTVKNKLTSSEYPAYVTFNITVNVKLPDATLTKVENALYWNNDRYNVNIAVPANPQSPAADAIFKTSLPQAYSTYEVEFANNIECATSYFKVIHTYANGVLTTVNGVSVPMAGVKVDGNDITLDKTAANVKAALNSNLGLQAVVAHVYVYPNGDEVTVNEFMVNFVRPVNLNMPSSASVVDATDDGDVADFQWTGLLTDWRGKAILEPGEEFVESCESIWVSTPIVEYDYAPGYNKLVTPAELEVEYDEVSFTTSVPTTMYTASASVVIQVRYGLLGVFTAWETHQIHQISTTNPYSTESEALADLVVKYNAITAPSGVIGAEYQKLAPVDLVYEYVNVPTGQLIEYTYVKSINYVPAVYEWIEGKFIPKPFVSTAIPTYDGTTEGQRVNEWVWTVNCTTSTEVVDGQYWNFYGPFGTITADIANVSTSLTYNNGELPVDVTLTQVGNTITYVNVGAPVGYEYEIYIPATITYGWGTLSTTLTIKVIPAN